jgi:superfamily II DNA or RNA helicase
MKLRPYQVVLGDKVLDAFQTHDRVMLQLSTGGGKTVLFSAIASAFIKAGNSVLVVAHREELLHQAKDKLLQITGQPVGIVQGGVVPDYSAPIQVASVASLVRRFNNIPKPGLIIIDEAHHATAASYMKTLAQYPKAKVLGVTATPIRLDGQGFDDLFDHLICGPSTQALINEGYLSKVRLFADAKPMSTNGVRRSLGDYSTSDMAEANNAIELAGNLVESYRRHADGLSGLVFAINVEHSQQIVKQYNRAGISAAHLDGRSSDTERTNVLDRLRTGRVKLVSNVGLFGEGFDVPDLGVVQIARPTQSLGLYLQMVGRVMRVSPGKEYGVLIDHTNNWTTHGLPTVEHKWSLDGAPKMPSSINLVRTESEEVLERREIVERDAQLVEVEAKPQNWALLWERLKRKQVAMGYKRGWLVYQLKKERNAPLELWRMAEQHLGYKRGWATYQWRESQGMV